MAKKFDTSFNFGANAKPKKAKAGKAKGGGKSKGGKGAGNVWQQYTSGK
jgi:hypothetical protein